jgi:general secretion pathway protein D
MATCIRRFRSFFLLIGAALIMPVVCSTAWASQEPVSPPAQTGSGNQAPERELRRNPIIKTIQAPSTPQNPMAPGAFPKAPNSNSSSMSGVVRLDLDNLDMYEFANQMATILGLTPMVIDSDVKGSVSLVMPNPIPLDEVFPLFNMILKSKGAALIKQGKLYQVVPIPAALKSGIEIIEHQPPSSPEGSEAETANEKEAASNNIIASGKSRAKEDSKAPRMVTHVIRAEFVPVKDLIEPIKLFMTDGGVIMPYERMNMLILTDYSDSAAKILELIRMLDNAWLDPDLIELVKMEYNKSADVAEDLRKIFGSGGSKDAATGVSFLSLDRLNAIFIMASSKRGLEEVKRWIKELDATSGMKFQTFVYVVQNSTASNIAMMITALLGGEDTTGSEGSSGNTSGGAGGFTSGNRNSQTSLNQGNATGLSNFGQTGFQNSSSNQNSIFGNQNNNSGYNQGGSGSFGSSQRLGPQVNPSRGVTSQILKGNTFSGLQDIVRLVVDDINNSLIIQSTPADYRYISETVKKIDVLPRQAIIDAKIYEVDLTDNFSLGISGDLQARTEGNITKGKLAATTGALSASTPFMIGNSRQIIAAIDALRKKTKVRILEAPSILALDGTQASFMVGSEIPYPTESYVTGTGGSTSGIQYRPTGISLIVTPQISASGSVTLTITQEVSSKGGDTSVGTGSTAPTFNKTSVANVFSVKDGETVAIAGLIRDSKDYSRGGIPILSEIPILGSLFGTTTRTARRTELIILITPHVIQTVEKFQEKTQELKDSLRNVRKFSDELDSEHINDMEDSRRERYLKERIEIKKIKPPKKQKDTSDIQ